MTELAVMSGQSTALNGWQALELLVKVGLTLWMLRISYGDHMSGRIPNRLTAPIFLGVGLYRLVEGVLHQGGKGWLQVVGLLVAWAVLFGMWTLHFIGGGDAKFLMALFALFPTVEFLAVLAFGLLVIMIFVLGFEALRQRPSLRGTLESWRARLLTGQLLPTEAELQTRGRRYAWTFALPALAYAWIYWDWPPPPAWWPW